MVELEAQIPNAFLAGGGEMGALMRARDWATTPLGPVEGWPQSLRSAVSIMLNSRYPIALYWGPELALLYNDAWSPIPGGKHPWALGRPGREVWPEIWDTIGPLYERVFSTGEGVWQADELLPMNRHGYIEECYYNFTFSPVRGEDGRIDGIFNAVVETTDRVLSERRLRTLSRMGERADPALSIEGACRWVVDILAENTADVPFALVYLRDGDEARLVAASSIEPASPAAPLVLSLEHGAATPWPLAEAQDAGAGLVIAAPDALDLPAGVWPEPVAQVFVVPVMAAAEARPSAFLVVGANPRRRIDAGYRSFFEMAAGHVATAVTTARAYEGERRRSEALAELDRSKTQFFSNVSHEFRTPLTLMLGPLEDALAEADRLEPAQRERLDVAHRNALRLLRLVNALLDFSRIEAGRAQARFRPTDLAAFTADLASSFRSATEKAGLALDVDTPPLPQPAHVDRDMWETIVLNLLSNAFKFTHRGGITVELREERARAVLTVRDTGTGIPASELPRLFDRFHRVAGAQGRSFEGSGIGLALVQELVALHGGEIAVESEAGRGSAFTITIPLGTAHLPAEHVEAGFEAATATVRAQSFAEEALRWLPDGTGEAMLDAGIAREARPPAAANDARPERRRVLLADDNADLRGYIGRLLRERGYEVEAVADGEAALAALRRARPDLLVTDVMMPRLDGFQLLRAVRDDPGLRDLPVIMLSARSGEDAKVEGLDAGADDYLTKPFSARELLARVASALALARLREEAAEAVRASEERAGGVLEGMAEGFLLLDRDFRVLDINAEALRLEKRPRDEIVGRRHWDIWPDTEDSELRRLLKRSMAERTPFALENHYVWPDGRDGWFEVRAYPAGSGISIFYRDVSDRKRADARLRESEEQLRLATEAAEIGLWDVDEISRTLFWPARVKAMFGISADVPVSMADFYVGLHPDDQGRVSQAYAAAADPLRRALYDVEYRAIGKEDGVVRWVAAKGRGVFDGEGPRARCLRVIGTAIDVSARKAIEERLRDLNETLERRVAEAVAEREETLEALRQAQKMEAMGQLTGGVAHDFNNLLTPIVGSLDMLQRKGLGGEREQRLIAGAMQSAERAKTLVQRLLAFARRQPLQPVAVDVARLVAGMVDLVASTTGPQIKVVVETPPDLPFAKADPNQLEMALLNLAVNARDAMPDGGTLRISASLERRAREGDGLKPGEYVRLSVADTGAGMDEATLKRAIEPFFSTKGVGKGTGLGLSMVHGLTSQLGGALIIRSKLGRGTDVQLWLPQTADAPELNDAAPPEAPTPHVRGTALLVDDEEFVRLSTSDMLRDLGYGVVEAASAEEALQLIGRNERFDLVVTDHRMPGMTGTDLARAIRTARPGLPVLLVSGYTETAGIEPGLPRLTKPFRKDELAASLAQLASPG